VAAMNLHDMLVHLLAVLELLRAELAIVHVISPGDKVSEYLAWWLAV
jgi:hypothetical protein